MIVLLEGPDNGGKSTLAQSLLSARLGARVYQTVGAPPSPLAMLDALQEIGMCATDGEDVVFDRSPIVSEGVYRRVFGGYSRLSVDLVDSVLWRIAASKRKHTLIYCRPPEEVALEFGEREQMPGVVEHGRELVRAYDDWYAVDTCKPLWRRAFSEKRVHDWTVDPVGKSLIADLQRQGRW